MKTIGIICEYNPLHNGHVLQMQKIREHFGENCAIVCAMSGNYVQRGAPAIFDKSIRAKAAVLCGADLVLELPVETVLSSAEGFGFFGVKALARCCDVLSFGTETMDGQALFSVVRALLSPEFSVFLKEELATGCSFPAAREAALRKMNVEYDLSNPNDILGLEYCKAILVQGAQMDVFPVFRGGSYHSLTIDPNAPSATAVRRALIAGEAWTDAVPEAAAALFQNARIHTLKAGERAIVAKLRSMTDAEFEALPFGSEGLWRKLRKAAMKQSDLAAIIAATKSKRYTRTRIDRMILCAFLGLTGQEIGAATEKAPLVLAFSNRGRQILHEHPEFRNAGEDITETERRIDDLYGLFCRDGIEPPGQEKLRRVYYHKE